MRAQLLIAGTFVCGLLVLQVACGTDTIYVYADGGAPAATSSGTTSSGSTGKSSTSSSSGSTSGDDDDDSTTTSSGGKDAGKDSGNTSSSGGFTVIPSTKLVDRQDVVLMGVVGDDAIYRTAPVSDTASPEVFAIPIAGGTATKIFEIGADDGLAISGPVIGHWMGLANNIGTLDVWSRAGGLKAGVATMSVGGYIRSNADGTRIAFSQDATFVGTKPNSTAIGIRNMADATNLATLNGLNDQVNLAAAGCPLRFGFAGKTFLAEFCTGITAGASIARLQSFADAGTDFVRLDAADDGASGTLTGSIAYSADAMGAKVVAAAAGGAMSPGKVFTVATPAAPPATLDAALQFIMTPDGGNVLYRTAANDLKVAVLGATVTVKPVATGALSLLGLSSDGKACTYNLAPKASTGIDLHLIDFTAATPTAIDIATDSTAYPLGFVGSGAAAMYLDASGMAPILKSVAVAGGASKTLATGAVGGRALGAGSGFLFYTNAPAPTAAGQPLLAEIDYVDALAGGAPKKIADNVPIGGGDTELFISGKRVVYTRLVNGNAEAIYTITLP